MDAAEVGRVVRLRRRLLPRCYTPAVTTLGGSHRLMLMFNAKDLTLRQWTVTDPQGYDTTVALYNLDASRKPDPGLFRINYERLRD